MKIEDLTLKEIKQKCEKGCDACPLYGYWRELGYEDCLLGINCSPSFWESTDMEREVKPNDNKRDHQGFV